MAPATEKWTPAHRRLCKRMQWNAICLAGLSISEQKRNNTKELGSRSTKKFKELIDTANILTLPAELRCEIPEPADWEKIKTSVKEWAELPKKDGVPNELRVSSFLKLIAYLFYKYNTANVMIDAFAILMNTITRCGHIGGTQRTGSVITTFRTSR